MMEKPPDLDKMITVLATLPVTPQTWQKETPTDKTPTESEKKKKKKKKSKEGEAAGLTTSMARKVGPKEAALREALDVSFGKLDEGMVAQAAQALGVPLHDVAPVEGSSSSNPYSGH